MTSLSRAGGVMSSLGLSSLFGEVEIQSRFGDQVHMTSGPFPQASDKNKMYRCRVASTEEFSYQQKTEELEELNKHLQQMKERLAENILKAHLLQVDLATQFTPETTDRLHATKLAHDHCKAVIDGSTT